MWKLVLDKTITATGAYATVMAALKAAQAQGFTGYGYVTNERI